MNVYCIKILGLFIILLFTLSYLIGNIIKVNVKELLL